MHKPLPAYCRRCCGKARPLYRQLFSLIVGLIVVLMSSSAVALSTPLEAGRPLMHHFSTRDYDAHGQNWAVLQHPNGLMYFGNTYGILQFDGLRWDLFSVANDTVVRSLALGQDGKVYVGAKGELGYLAADQYGHMRYHSLTKRVPESMQGFGDVWQTFVFPDGVYFRTTERLLRWDGVSFQSWEPPLSFHRAFQVDQRLLIRQVNAGLFELIDNELHLLPGSERFAEELIFAVLPWDHTGNTLLVGTRSQGFWLFDGQHWTPWLTEANAAIEQDLIYHATWLPGELLGVATEQGGLYILNREGRWVAHWNRDAGLPGNSIRYTYLDSQQGLWLAMNNGISRIEAGGQFSHFDEKNGLLGTVINVHRHQGQLYAGTSEGLFYLVPGTKAHFKAVEGIRTQTWDFLSFEHPPEEKAQPQLLVANRQGVFVISGDQAKNVQPLRATQTCLEASTRYPGRIYICSYGLNAIEYRDGEWQDLSQIPGLEDEIRSLVETEDGRLWLGSRMSGVQRLEFSDENQLYQPAHIERFGIEHGLPDLDRNNVYWLNGAPVFSTLHGLFRFDETHQLFVPEPRFAGLFGDEQRRLAFLGKPAFGQDGRFWIHSRNTALRLSELGVAVPQANGDYRWDPRPLAAVQSKMVVPILLEPDGTLWLGGVDGLVRFNTSLESDFTQPFQVMLRHISQREGAVLYGGSSGSHHIQHRTPLSPKTRLRFEFAATSYNSLTANRFQYRLDGVDKDWSPWSSEAFTDYANLWEGHYKFRVRAKNRYDLISEEAVFAFEVLPPWYRSGWAYAGYVLGLILLVWLGFRIYIRQLAARNRQLKREVRARTQDLESALTELKETQKELVASEKMATAGRLVAGMAHQINTPVGNGKVTASVLLEQVHGVKFSFKSQQLGRSKLENFLDTCEQGVGLMLSSLEKVANLVQNLRKITEASQESQSEWFVLEHLLSEIECKRREQTERQGVQLRYQCPPGLKIHGNWLALMDCINELIDNSLSYGFPASLKDKGKQDITIEVSAHDDKVVIHYQDNGQGIRPELRDRIFEPFAASMHGDSRHPGLGMHRVFSVIKHTLQGHIELLANDEGVHFVIKLPREAACQQGALVD